MKALDLVLAVSIIFAPPAVMAQATASAPTCYPSSIRKDTVNVRVFLHVSSGITFKAYPELNDTIAVMIRGRLSPPPSLNDIFYPGTAPKLQSNWLPTVLGTFAISVDAHGRVSRTRWIEPLRDSAASRAILEALQRAIDAGERVRLSGVRADSGDELHVRVIAGNYSSTATMLVARVPFMRVDSAPVALEYPAARYPLEATHAPRATNVTLEFVVDEAGKAERESLRVAAARYVEFVDAAVDAVMSAQFKPAMSGGCPVKYKFVHTVQFRG
jgi:TonB family protein